MQKFEGNKDINDYYLFYFMFIDLTRNYFKNDILLHFNCGIRF